MTLDSHKVKRLWRFLKPYWHLEVLAFLTLVALSALGLALPAAIQYMIDTLIPSLMAQGLEKDFAPIYLFALFLLGIYLAYVVFAWLRDYFGARLGTSIVRDLRSHLFGHLERLSSRFYQERQTGEILSRMMSDASRIENLLTETLLMFAMDILVLIAILGYLLETNWTLTLVAIIPVPLTILTTHYYGRRMHGYAATLQEKTGALSARIHESLMAMRTIRAFGQEKREQTRMDSTLENLSQVTIKASVVSSLAVNLVQFINMVGPVIVLGWGVYLVAAGEMKLGALIAFYMLMAFLYSPIQSLARAKVQFHTAMASVDRIFEYLDVPPDVVESAHPVELHEARGEIMLRDVSFAYPHSPFALRNVSLLIRPHEKVAIVGPSGSGKTTIINLILRFLDPDAGTLLLDGIDIRQLSFATLRRQIAIVEQDPTLFKATVSENIGYGRPEATPAEIQEAARAANIHDFIMTLPKQYDAEVGERGVTISGGERQRLCLARAILCNPAVLILDEATSALDANSEQLIQQSLNRILVDKTAIIIAHRLATVKHTDRIIAIDDGRILDQGTHEELSSRCALYRELAQKQLLL
jgi:ABC-type multidrug transport system fused ATPase/permease subunit